eukprot:g13135.t1
MPPYRRAGGRGSGAGVGAQGTKARAVNKLDTDTLEWFSEVANGTGDVALGVGVAEQSFLDQGVHQKLATEVQKLAAADARLELKRKATISALRSMAAEMDKRATRAPGAAGANDPPAEQMNLEYFLQIMRAKVSSDMEGADQRALESNEYKEVMKKVMPPDDDDDDEDVVPSGGTQQVSLKCPITSTTIVDPVKNKVCKHTYGRAAIEQHIRIGGGHKAKCPVAGCSNEVTMGDMVEDKEMKRRLRIESQTQSTIPEQDAEEIDDEMPVGETCI